MKMDETLSGRFVMECLAALMAVERRTAELEGDASQSEDVTVREIGSGVAGNYRRILEMLNERLSELSWRDMQGEPLTVAKMRDALDRGEDRWTISRVDHGTADWGTEPVASFVIPSPTADPLDELDALGGYVGCTNDAEEIWACLGHEYKCIHERCGGESHAQATIPELRAAAARLVERARSGVKP